MPGPTYRILRILATSLLVMTSAKGERYRFRHYGPDEGLNTAVSQIIQDRIGFLWVGTGNGLYRYDGGRFQRFGTEDGLPSSSIRCLHVTADGTLWVVTGRGLSRRRHNAFETVDLGLGRDTPDLRAISSDPKGRLYVGFDRGLLTGEVKPDGSASFRALPEARADAVSGVYAEADGRVWFSSGRQLGLLEGGRVRIYDEKDGLPPERWSAMLRDPRGELWVRGSQHLSVLPPGGQRFIARDADLPQSSNTMMTLALDHEGHMMASTDLGLARWMDGRWQLTGTAQGLESDSVTTVYEDREGSIWIGLWGAGIARWPGSSEWTNWTTADGLSNNIVWAVRRHPSGAMWLGTDRGLARMEADASFRIWTKKEGLGGDKIKALSFGQDGAVWAACLPGGVTRIDPVTGKTRAYGHESGLADDRVIALHLDRENRLWASTNEGLFRSTPVDGEVRFERLWPPGTDDHTLYLRIAGDREGRVWVGSSRGLYRWERDQWTRFTARDGLRSNGISHLAEAPDGSMWVSYREPLGLSRLTIRGSTLQAEHFTRQNGLPSDYVLFLGLDAAKRLWVGTDNGVAVRYGAAWRVYTHEDGLVWDDCAANSFWSEPDGTVWVGTLKGLSRYRPNPRLAPLSAPPVSVTSVRFGDHAGDPDAYSQVPFRDRDFLVTFAGLTFLSEKNVRFRYRLSGLDDRWIETGLREVRYPSLPAASYRFEVEARIANGPWSPRPAAVAFRVVPPWWQTWWFRVMAVGGLGALLGLGMRARMLQMMREQRRLETAVKERTSELELQKNLVERQKQEIEELLRQSQEVSRLKSEFLANMSHEIRTPMNGVIGMTQLVLNTPLDKEQRDYINTVRESADALLVVINDILDFSKIEAGKMELAHDPFFLRKSVSDALQMFAWKAHEKGLRLHLEISPEVPEILVGDSDRLRQILLNLIGNAMKFTEHGEIQVTVQPDGMAVPSARSLLFSVRDTGIGIAPDKQAVIFEAFEQADGSARRRKGGTGLGLAICSKLVHLMNGQIWVESTPGIGSTFSFQVTLSLPESATAPASKAAGETAAPLSNLAHPLRILLAEDNIINQKVARRVIEKLGHSITVVENGGRAVAAASKERFDLILMDLQMPEMDGFEATARIRQIEQRAHPTEATYMPVPIVAMTAHAMSGDRDLCLHKGMDGYISKPIHVQTLVETIHHFCGKAEGVG